MYEELIQSNVDIALSKEEVVPKGDSKYKRRRRKLKKYRNKYTKDFLPRKQKYEEAQEIFDGRNSFLKTYTDTTFMCMKEDPMKNRELNPGITFKSPLIISMSSTLISFQIQQILGL